MNHYRVGGSWKTQTIILEGVEPPDDRGKRADDRPVAFVDSGAPEGLAAEIVALLNDGERAIEYCPQCDLKMYRGTRHPHELTAVPAADRGDGR